MLLRILRKSLARRKFKVIAAMVAVMMGASIASALLNTSMSMSEKIGEEFRRFGANIMVLPESDSIDVGMPGISFGSVTEQRYINETDLWKIKDLPTWSAQVLGYAPFLYQVVEAESGGLSQSVALVGTYFDRPDEAISGKLGVEWRTGVRNVAPYWSVDGEWAKDNDTSGSLVGIVAAEKLGLEKGSTYSVTYVNPDTKNATTYSLRVDGILSTGGQEDSQIFTSMDVAQEISSRPNKVHTVQVSALCTACPAETIAAEIEATVPYVEAKSVKQLVNAEERIMMSLERTMLLVTVVALVASTLGVMTTMTTTVAERSKEIGLMKAVGASNRRVAVLFFSEAVIIGLAGGALGLVAGYFIAQYIGQSVFASPIIMFPIVIPFVIGLSIIIALLASAPPVRRATKIEPATVLRGE